MVTGKMKKRSFLFTAAVMLLGWVVLFPAQARGQGNTWAGTSLAQMVEGARWKFGTLRVNATFSLSNVGYDSDVLYGYTPEPVPDFTLSAGSTVQVLMPLSKKIIVEIVDSPQYVFYLDTKRERAWNNTFGGQVHFALDRFYIQAGGGYSNARQRLSSELNINIRQKTNSLNGTVLWQVSRETSLALLYGGASYDYGDAEFGGTSIAESQNRKENYFDFVTYIQPTTRVRFFLDGKYGKYTFTEAISGFRDARSYGLFGGIEFIPRVGEVLQKVGVQGSLSLGYLYFNIDDPARVDGSGFSGKADISAELMKKTTVRASFSRGFQFSIYSGSTYYLQTSYGGGISRLLSRKVTLSYDISFSRSSYPGDEAAGEGAPQGIRNLHTMHTISLNFRLARHLGLTFLGSLAKRSFDQTGLARNRNFFGFNLVYGSAGGTMSAPRDVLSR
jgi:hypothetical protein